MTMPSYGNLPAGFKGGRPVVFTAGNTTVAKLVVDGELFPSSAAIGADPPFYGGGTLLDLTACSTDGASKDVYIYLGSLGTKQDATDTGVITLTAQNKLTRTTGSWITDGWGVGDLVMPFVPFGSAQVVAGIDGILGIVTAVTALDLTVNGTPWAAGSNILSGGTRLIVVTPRTRIPVPANSGTNGTLPNVQLMANFSYDATKVTSELKFGSTDFVIAALAATASALPAYVAINPNVARY